MFAKFLRDSADYPRKKNLPSCHDNQYSAAISLRSSTSVQAMSSTWTWQKLITTIFWTYSLNVLKAFLHNIKWFFFKILMDGFFSFVWEYRNDWLLHNRFPFDFDIQYSVAISWRSSTSVQTISSTWTWQKLTTANGPHEIFSLPKEKEPRDFVFGPF